MINFNVNNYVFVKLTNEGRNRLRYRHDRLWADWPEEKRPHYTLPTEDEDGWSRWQMWCLIQLLGGEDTGMGTPVLFETNIRIEVDRG